MPQSTSSGAPSRARIVSVPASPDSVSRPPSPVIVSLPLPPRIVFGPALPASVSCWGLPQRSSTSGRTLSCSPASPSFAAPSMLTFVVPAA